MIKLLIVQPDTTLCRELTGSLKEHAMECIPAGNLKQAMRALDCDYLIDAVLVSMGRGNGFANELLQTIRDNVRYQYLPVLMTCNGCAANQVVEALQQGATDVISLPLPPDQIAQRIVAAAGKGKKHILVVDDEPVIREYLTEMLRIERFSPLAAGSGKEALEILAQSTVQAVISDITMPGMDGLELLVEVKQKYDHLPVILITGNGTKFDAQEALAAGADGYFQKPFKNIELIRTLRAILNEAARARRKSSQPAAL
jgi:DNA-binding response OmpR family regulator